jgi:Tfp pilus assembly protein PilV
MNRAQSAKSAGRVQRARAGFSLMEVLLATSMLLASVIVLGELAGIGRRHASAARELATAQILCENKLNEILAGAAPLTAVDGEPLEEEPGWIYTVKIEPVGQSSNASSPSPRTPRARPSGSANAGDGVKGLSVLTVTVAPEEEQTREKDHRTSKEFSLTRWVRDPAGSQARGQSVPTSDVPRRSNDSRAITNR